MTAPHLFLQRCPFFVIPLHLHIGILAPHSFGWQIGEQSRAKPTRKHATLPATPKAMEAAAVKPVLRVAAVCGSLRKASYNRGLLRAGIPASSLLLATTPARPLTPLSRRPVLPDCLIDQRRRCARSPSRGCAWSTSTSPTSRCSTPTSRRPTGGSRRPSRPSATASAAPTASSSARPSTTTPSQVRALLLLPLLNFGLISVRSLGYLKPYLCPQLGAGVLHLNETNCHE
jgi:hypothetical protein